MKITQHGNNLWKLTRFFVVNYYLVREDDGLTLIDSGLSGGAGGILKAAAAIGQPITRITLTHAHGDHAGSLDELRALLPETVVAFSARTAAFLQGDLSLLPDEPQAQLRGSFINRQTQPTRVLQPDNYLGSLRVVAAPGHAPDQIAFFDERDGTLIAGDAFQTQGGIAVSGIMRWRFPLPAMATWHLPTALETARALRRLNPARLVVGHGGVLDAPQAQMDQAIATAATEVEQSVQAMAYG
ncbi:MAG: MBL fold metallo-hydrolase [Candidatus Promineifilaceae bacterium]|nr:MBL fold metallo-hydrolase [Candidatus Promineifilaceae bacterium]